MEGVDYSYDPPDPRRLASEGKYFAVRYVGTPSYGKNLTAAEVSRLLAAGIDVVAVYQTTKAFMTTADGAAAARAAFANAEACGMPAGRPIYFALDINPWTLTPTQWAGVRRFLDQAAEEKGRSRIGVYGGLEAIVRLCPQWAPWGWQTYAWSAGAWSPKAQLQQYRNGVSLAGGTVDLCRSMTPDYGQWFFHIQSLPQEDDMTPEQMAELKHHIDGRLVQTASWLTTGKPNTYVDPGKPTWAFADDAATFTLNEIAAKIADLIPSADDLATLIAAKLPAGSADVALIKAAMREVIAEVRFDVISQGSLALDEL